MPIIDCQLNRNEKLASSHPPRHSPSGRGSRLGAKRGNYIPKLLRRENYLSGKGPIANLLSCVGVWIRLIIHRASVVGSPAALADARGMVMSTDGKLLVATGDGLLSLDEVQPAGKLAMVAAELLRGYPIQVGHKFG